jgi:hypothetical protein
MSPLLGKQAGVENNRPEGGDQASLYGAVTIRTERPV